MSVFLKWPGSKRRLVGAIEARLPPLLPGADKAFRRYYEPMGGSLATFFHLNQYGWVPRQHGPVLSDINYRLMTMYGVVRDNVENLIEVLESDFTENEADVYYTVREDFNKPDQEPLHQAARLIYMNRLGYNGLFRENKKGEYNVPFGKYKNPKICNRDALRAASKALQGATLRAEPYEVALNDVSATDFVYLDPPYVPLNPTSSFTSFSAGGFSEKDQRELASFCQNMAERGVFVMLSNSDTPLVREMYSGFHLHEVEDRRSISPKAESRGKVRELLITSYDVQAV